MLSRLAAAYAGIGNVFLYERNATGLNATGKLLECILTLALAAPHSLDKSGIVLSNVKEFLTVVSNACLFLKVLKRSLIKLVMNRLKRLLYLFGDVIKRYELLLSCNTAYEYTAIVLNITRAKLKTERNALHLVLAELPTR